MEVKVSSSAFGGRTRRRALLALRLLGESYPRELARLLEAPLSGGPKAPASLERGGLGTRGVLPGGACASLHPRGAYQSRDMDFILVGATTRARLDTAMSSVGF